ncbi:O-antigen ligase family protein [Hymenobacter sp. NST-14]|uniref:O-antigen ligase family protein n=1 Tax=Hymenobacter piscis TaxID=2839984 RepID=UPI001C00EFF8|nr:O-antigen ligase family protein [Hymenobacter piscis]MBT9393578.1 O-antigen ligase family protein [Hymenobacter piscis]
MKISLRFRHALPLLLLLFTDRAFNEFLFADEEDPVLGLYNYALLGLALLLIAGYFRYLNAPLRRWLLVLGVALGALALESYNGWGSPMVYPHVFAKLTILLPAFGLFAYYRRHELPAGLLMALVLAGLLLNLALYHPDALSLSAFLENERGFQVTSALLLLFVGLYYFNQYLRWGGLVRLGVFFLIMGLIVFLQHRTVWLAAGLALVLNGLLIAFGRVEGVRFTAPRLVPMLLLPLVVGGLGGVATVLDNPQVLRRLEESVGDIQNADKQGTGSWRLHQLEAYQPFVEENPLLGLRLAGFELPIQFYGEDDQPLWQDRTGHHFHSFYLDRLFYFGILGLLLVVAVPIGQLIRRVRQPVPLSPTAAALVCFTGCTLLYGFSYDWPPFLYAVLGLTLAQAAPLPYAAVAGYRAARAAGPLPAAAPPPEPSSMPASYAALS